MSHTDREEQERQLQEATEQTFGVQIVEGEKEEGNLGSRIGTNILLSSSRLCWNDERCKVANNAVNTYFWHRHQEPWL